MSIYTNQFYVYIYLREDGTPYYVGKGKGNRAWSNSSRSFKKPTDESRIVIHTDNLTEEQAFSLEKDLISYYGRKGDGGVLRNLTDGGEGVTGHSHSEETRARMSKSHTGAKRSDYHKRRISETTRGIPKSEATKKLLSESKKGVAQPDKYKRCMVDGVEYESIQAAAEALGIKYDTAAKRFQRGKKGWSYV